MDPERSELSALDLENLPYFIFYVLESANIGQSAPDLVTIYMTIRSQMSSSMGHDGAEHPEFFALESRKKLLNFTMFTF